MTGGARLSTSITSVVTIRGSNDPHGIFGFEAPSLCVEEPATGSTTSPSRFAALGATIDAVTVYYRTLTSAGAFFGTAADDYAAIPETAVVFAEGESEKMVPVNLVIRGDNILCTIRLLAPGSKAGCFWEQTLNETKGNLQLS